MTLPMLRFRWPAVTTGRLLRALVAAALLVAVGWGGVVSAANNSVQGAKKEEGGFDGDAPTAILTEATSGAVLFEKNADELRAPSSMMKLMTAEVVFHAVKQGDIKLSDEYRVSENAWRKGGAPAGGSTMFAALNSKVSVDDLLHGAIIQSGNDSCMVLAEGIAGNERAFAEMMTQRAREIGLPRSTFANSNGLPDPGNKMTVRELAMLARHIMQTCVPARKAHRSFSSGFGAAFFASSAALSATALASASDFAAAACEFLVTLPSNTRKFDNPLHVVASPRSMTPETH
jgi:D-alanyl-D-alanine carboxypeptidase (penicillin-binding protein 5/6)